MANLDEEYIEFIETARFDGNVRQWGMTGGYSWLTDITSVKNGKERRNAVYAQPRGSWEIGNRGVTEKENIELQDFHYSVMGRLIGFRMRDWMDFKDDGKGISKRTEGSLSYQMYKKREIKLADVYRLQKITKPVGPTFTSFPDLGNTIQFFWNNEEIFQSSNTSNPLTITLDDTKGIFVFNPANLNVSVDGSMFTSSTNHGLKKNDGIRFTRDSEVIYTYITEVVDEKRFRTAYNQMFTASSLNVNPYPTDSSNFKWTGLFDKAVRFDTDNINPTVQLFNESQEEGGQPTIALQLPSIQIIELPK